MTRSGTVLFGAVGDVALYGKIAEAVLANGEDWPFEKMRPFLARAELLFGNMEAVLVPESFPRERMDPAGLVAPVAGPFGVAGIRRAGFDFLNLAANHALDAGEIGLEATRRYLTDAGIATAGVGKTQDEARRMTVVEKNGLRFGFLCYGEDSNYTLGTTGPSYAYYEPDALRADIARHRDAVDVLVVSVHADLEFLPTPAPRRLREFRDFARAGATLVLGHHPHVPQGVERVGKSLVAYSLGNFVFPAHTSAYMKNNGPHTAHSFLLLAEVGKDGARGFERIPFVIGEPPEERPAPVEGAAREAALAYLADLDEKIGDEAFVRETWRATALRMFAAQLDRLKNQSPETILDEWIGRLWLTRENRMWMDEIVEIARERWARQAALRDPLRRPHCRFSEKRKS